MQYHIECTCAKSFIPRPKWKAILKEDLALWTITGVRFPIAFGEDSAVALSTPAH